MYHPLVPWSSHELRFPDFLWTTTFVHGGAIGVQLKSNVAQSMLYANKVGFVHDGWSNINVRYTWSRSHPHKHIGNFLSALLRPVKNVFSKF